MLLGRERVELGDDVKPPIFVHWFSEAEINAEFTEAGFKMIYYSAQEYGHAVGLAA